MAKSRRKSSKKDREPTFQGWITTDAEEVQRRRWRGRNESFDIQPADPDQSYHGTYEVRSSSGRLYRVEIRDLKQLTNSCTCADYDANGLGTCKHIEGVLHHLRKAGVKAFREAAAMGSPFVEVFIPGLEGGKIQMQCPSKPVPKKWLEPIEGVVARMRRGDPTRPLAELRELGERRPDLLRVSHSLERWAERRTREIRSHRKRNKFLKDVEAGRKSLDVLRFPLFPYQREGMLHLAFGERVLLADDMGLGKTVQALAACALLHELGAIERVLVVCPASLKSEWEEQIKAATDFSLRIVSGSRAQRLTQYEDPEFFTLINYEQILVDEEEIQRKVAPDVIILDEAQRIKNWRTKTASAVKRLRSRYAFVLTGTPLENRIEEVYSIIQYLDPKILGPLFRFNRDYYEFDEHGHPLGYRNLDLLAKRIQPVMLRRRKEDIESELPDRTLNNYFLDMTEEQSVRYGDYKRVVDMYASLAKRRPLTPEEFERLQIALACMRMVCDTPYILDETVRDCPKLEEMERVLEELLEDQDRKILVFSEWVRMLELVRHRLEELEIGFALHTGSVPQDRRRAEINRFKRDPECRLFLSSESGGTGLNLQVASAVINLDLPWNPAKLEQRIARAWRKHQTRSVNVVNLITQGTIEHRMLDLLEKKRAVADAVLDGRESPESTRIKTGRAAFFEKLGTVMGVGPDEGLKDAPDPVEDIVATLQKRFGRKLARAELRKSEAGQESVLAVLEDAALPKEGAMPAEAGRPAVEFIGRESYETIQRLEAAGHLAFSANRVRVLYAAKADDPEDKIEWERRREKAREWLKAADRQHRMATLLAGGGFEDEAEAQVGEIAVLSLRALAAMDPGEAARGAGEGDEEPVADLCDRLGGGDLLPVEFHHKALWLCGMAVDGMGESDEGVPASQEGLPSGLVQAEALLSHVRERVSA